MELNEFIRKHVMTDPEWREAYEEADAAREGARALARARRAAGLSQAALAERVGTDQAVISRIERGAVSPTLDMLTRIARGLDMRPIIAFEPIPAGRRKASVRSRKTTTTHPSRRAAAG
ncbi:MAG: helix-turn-helix transcriptional regulator [Actinomycetota bacterium]